MATVATGLWRDYSSSAILGSTLTLSVTNSNYLLSALAFLVTVAGASFWNITAFVLHHLLSKKTNPDDVDLQHRVLFRNAPAAGSSAIWLLKMYGAWRKEKRKGLIISTLLLMLPALLVLAAFSAASILTSRVANKSYAGTLAPVSPNSCGVLTYNNTPSVEAQSWRSGKILNEALRARSYVRDIYYGSLSSAWAWSIFPKAALEYTGSLSADCPFPNVTRCALGSNSALLLETGYLDSHSDLGINAVPADRISVKIRMVCSPLRIDDLVFTTQIGNQTYAEAYLGPVPAANWTSTYQAAFEGTGTRMSYFLLPAFATPSDPQDGSWLPISDFNVTSADVNAYFLSQYRVFYANPVSDPFFAAHQPVKFANGNTYYSADSLITAIGCTTTYSFCNQSKCTLPAGLAASTAEAESWSSLSTAARLTLNRLAVAISQSNPYIGVDALEQNALWAASQLFAFISPGLPDNQWANEVLGWFQTALTMLQGYILEFATKAGEPPSSDATLWNPYGEVNPTDPAAVAEQKALQQMCTNTLISTTGQVQNFSFLGIMVVVCGSILLVLLDWSLEGLVNLVRSRKRPSPGKLAREADGKLHLLRMALGPASVESEEQGEGDGWKAGFMDVPVRRPQTHAKLVWPVAAGQLVSYSSGKGSQVVMKTTEESSQTRNLGIAPPSRGWGGSGYQSGWAQPSGEWRYEPVPARAGS